MGFYLICEAHVDVFYLSSVKRLVKNLKFPPSFPLLSSSSPSNSSPTPPLPQFQVFQPFAAISLVTILQGGGNFLSLRPSVTLSLRSQGWRAQFLIFLYENRTEPVFYEYLKVLFLFLKKNFFFNFKKIKNIKNGPKIGPIF